MALSINPLAKLVSSVSSSVASATNAAGGSLMGDPAGSLKAGLDQTVSSLSGGIGSGLNGATSGISDIASSAGTALAGVGNQIQSLASNATGAVSQIAGQLGGAAGAISNIGSSISQGLNSLGLGSGGLGGLASLAGQISSAAGALNNILSLARGKNIPSGAELFSAAGSFVEVSSADSADWRVRLNANFGLFGNSFSRLTATNGFVWPYLPTISLVSKANYAQIDPIHNIQPFQAFKNSQVEDIQISGEFSVENSLDAEYWIQGTTFLRTATKMFFGKSQYAGNPPIVCNLSGYGSRVFNNVSVIVKSFSVDFKEDVGYFRWQGSDGKPTWVPVMSTISVTVSPIYNRTKLRQFSLQDYAQGKTVGYI